MRKKLTIVLQVIGAIIMCCMQHAEEINRNKIYIREDQGSRKSIQRVLLNYSLIIHRLIMRIRYSFNQGYLGAK